MKSKYDILGLREKSRGRTHKMPSLFKQKQEHFNWLFIHTVMIWSIILFVLGQSIPVQAQDTGIDNLNAQSVESISRSFTDYIPYLQYNSYQYDGQNEHSTYVLLEYGLDDQSVFQVSILSDNGENSTKLYQVKSDGLYEVAHYDNLSQVSDLREGQSYNQNGSLVLSSNLSKGQSFRSGYNGEFERRIQAILPVWIKGKLKFEDVVVIEERGYENGQTIWYYYAPYFGLICKEVRDNQGQTVSAVHLDRIYNTTE